MVNHYVLHGVTPEPEPDLIKWARAFEENDRRVAANSISRHGAIDGAVMVSTVFLGLDHNLSGIGPPLLFETMVFGGDDDGYRERYATWDEAEAGHAAIVSKVVAGESLNDDEVSS